MKIYSFHIAIYLGSRSLAVTWRQHAIHQKSNKLLLSMRYQIFFLLVFTVRVVELNGNCCGMPRWYRFKIHFCVDFAFKMYFMHSSFDGLIYACLSPESNVYGCHVKHIKINQIDGEVLRVFHSKHEQFDRQKINQKCNELIVRMLHIFAVDGRAHPRFLDHSNRDNECAFQS